MTVADTGPGIEPAVKKRMFEAIFITKAIGETGLGLWVSLEIVERHRGVLRVRSRLGKDKQGMVFSVFLPLNAEIRQQA